MDAANSIKARRGWIPLLTTAAFLMSAGTAIAQETEPGDTCAGFATGSFRQSAGDGTIGHILICDGTNWQPLFSHNSDGNATTIGNLTCGDGDVLTYDGDSSIWTCTSGNGGSSLWEEVGGVLRPTSATPRITLNNTSTATGSYSVAWGSSATASGDRSTAWGGSYTPGTGPPLNLPSVSKDGGQASGQTSTAWGESTTASGDASTAWGANATASGAASTAWGSQTTASGTGNTAWGSSSITTGNYSTAWGMGSHAGSYLETSLGRYSLNTAGQAMSWTATDTLFEIGNGANSGARANAVTVLKNGKVGIGVSAPAVALDVNGDIQYTGFIADVSDYRLKTNIQSLSHERGDAIAALKPVSFEMKDRKGLRELGFIAQDVEQVFPELVQTSESGTKSMNYIGLIAPMVKAIQQLQADNEALKAKVDAMTCDKQGTEAAEQPAAPHSLND